MSHIRAKDTGPERMMRAVLSAAGIRGYRLNYTKAPGRPDIAFVGKRVAIFVHGCFWHGCPYCRPVQPRSNASFWRDKMDRNKARDLRKVRELRKAGWSVVTVWACRLKKMPHAQLERIIRLL
jgi:DNA mismatch endonuclease (patch repair protein)